METIENQLQKFITKTEEGKIPWTYQNANIVRWVRSIPNGKTVTCTLQMQPTPPSPNSNIRSRFIFTIQAPGEVLLQINTLSEPGYNDLLNKLFVSAKRASQGFSDKVIDDLLSDL